MTEVNNTFSESINEEKMDRIYNLPNPTKSNRDMNTFLDFFEKKWVNISTIRKFLDKELTWTVIAKDKENIIEWLVTQLSLNDWKEIIISSILEKWPFNDPKDLIKTIAEYIKNKMHYDWVTALFSIRDLEQSITWKYIFGDKIPDDNLAKLISGFRKRWINLDEKTENEMKKSNENWNLSNELYLLLIDYIWNEDYIWFNQYHLNLFWEIINDLKTKVSIQDLPWDFQLHINEIISFIELNDIKWFTDYFYSQFRENVWFRNFLVWLYQDGKYHQLLTIWNNSEVINMLEEVKTWVCRHYSVIMREIYNEIVKNKEWINFSWESTMLYVLNYERRHAYNILAYEWLNWNIEKKYLDITSFIGWGALFKKVEEIKNIKWEVWANNKWFKYDFVT